MKKVFIVPLVAFALLLAVSGAGLVYAQQNNQDGQSVPPSRGASDRTSETPAAVNAEELEARLEERRTRLQTRLSDAEKARVSGRCVAAQAKAEAVLRKIEKNQQPYKTRFEAYIERLEKMKTVLEENDIDTGELTENIATLESKYTAYKASVDQLTQAMTDLKAMDCRNEPNGFKATLEDSRSLLNTVRDNRMDLRDYTRETVKATLESIKAAAQAKNETETETENE